jgi:anti-sigma B factor antagonist
LQVRILPGTVGSIFLSIRDEDMSASRMTFEDYAGVTLVTMTDSSILDSTIIEQIAKDLYRLPDQQNKQKIVLDFSRVKSLSSSALGVLINLNKKVQAIKGRLAICGISSDIRRIFAITQLEKDFNFYPDDSAALKAFDIKVK